MKEVTVNNYQELAMQTCLPSAKNWEYCYCLIASEIGEAFGKWGKKFRDGEFDKKKLTDELGDVFWGVALACELGGYNFDFLWDESVGHKPCSDFVRVKIFLPDTFNSNKLGLDVFAAFEIFIFTKTFAEECGIDPIDCLRRNIAKLADRQARGVIKGNGDER